MKNYDSITKWLIKNNYLFYENYDLRVNSWFKTGGICKFFICPENTSQLINLVNTLKSLELKFRIFGSTANCFFLDEVSYGIIISSTKIRNNLTLNDNIITADTGCLISELSRFALYNGITGYEGFEGIPGTIGGAVVMNAGAYSSIIENVVIKVDCLNKNGSIFTLNHKDLAFDHRYSIFQNNKDIIILKCYFKSIKGNKAMIYKKMSLFHEKRHKHQEFIYPNLGSIFAGSPYILMKNKNFFFNIIFILDFIFFKKLKLFPASNNKKFLNYFACKIFDIKFKKKPFSDKNLNTLINDKNSSKELIKYIEHINKVIGNKLKLENEIINKF